MNQFECILGSLHTYLPLEGGDALLEFDVLGAHVVPETFLSVQLRLGLGQLAVQPRQLLLLRLETQTTSSEAREGIKNEAAAAVFFRTLLCCALRPQW